MNNTFKNCLRIQITPDDYADERIERLLYHCKKYGLQDVVFFITAEEHLIGHPTLEEVRPWIETIKKAAKVLRENGIGVSLHHGHTVGHDDRGIGLKEGQNFTTMVDKNGTQSIVCACMTDENWRAYFTAYLGEAIREIKPDFYWVEDDFRLHNHKPLEWGGCFCEKHMQMYNAYLGTNYTREEFCEKAFQTGKPTKEREAWLAVSEQTMIDYAAFLRKVIKEANPATKLALMTSAPTEHCMESRNWEKVFDALCGDDGAYNRVHLPGYFQSNGKEYMFGFNHTPMAIRAFSPRDTKILPELENGSLALFRKDVRFMGFQLEAALPLCLSGMTYNIHDSVGVGPVEGYGFPREITRLTPYLQAVMDTNAQFADMRGVVVQIDEKICYKKDIKNGFFDLRTNLFEPASYLSSLGLTYRFSTEKAFHNETVCLFSDAVYIFTDEQLKALFADNTVMVDGGAVLLLQERGLLSLIGATDAKLYQAQSGYQSFEEMAGDEEIFGVKKFRASCRVAAGPFVKIEYGDAVTPLSYVYDAKRSFQWNGFVQKENVLINPFVVDRKLYTQFTELRRHFVSRFLEEKTAVLANTRYEGVHPYVYTGENETVVMLINATLEQFEKTAFFVKGVAFNNVLSVDKDGVTRPVSFAYDGDMLVVDRPLDYMSSVTLKLIK